MADYDKTIMILNSVDEEQWSIKMKLFHVLYDGGRGLEYIGRNINIMKKVKAKKSKNSV